ncbi:MAG: radical SAM protein [Candidatus Omnitrophica bacterium]|nr:radical SAM protein [Candidatus Omnitrophota bacterium]
MDTAERIEWFLGRPYVQSALKWMTRLDKNGNCILNDIFISYDNPGLPLWKKIRYAPILFLIGYFRKRVGTPKETIKKELFRHDGRRRAIIATARSIGAYGLTRPQKFWGPILCVWNFTNRCNLSCIHCYQDARGALPDEMTLDEKKRAIDILYDNDTIIIAFSGGEPLTEPTFWPTAEYARKKGLELTIATNGTLLTKEMCSRLADVGIKYVEISLDSLNPEVHNKFRGKDMWQKTVEGIKNSVAEKRFRTGIATTITRLNFHEFKDIAKFSLDLGCHKFCAFNFVPTGRAKEITDQDLTPEMREEMLDYLYRALDRGEDVMCTSPQLGRFCIEASRLQGGLGNFATAHIAAGKGSNARMFAKYLGGCGAGRCYVALQPNGNITPCVFMPKVIANILRDDFRTWWEKNEVLVSLRDRDDRTGGCLTCDYKLFCGGCRARPYGYFGDYKASDPGCIYNKEMWETLVRGDLNKMEAKWCR